MRRWMMGLLWVAVAGCRTAPQQDDALRQRLEDKHEENQQAYDRAEAEEDRSGK